MKKIKENKENNKEKNNNKVKIIKSGKKIDEAEITKNEKESKKKTIIMYLVPMTILVIVGTVYIVAQRNWLLVIFAILMFIVLWGWDSSTRVCPKCKKWNSVVWIKTERFDKKEEKIVGKKKKESKIKYTRNQGKCKNCGCIYETIKQRIL